MDLNVNVPTWRRARLNLNLGPLSNMISTVKNFVSGTNNNAQLHHERSNEVLNRAAQNYAEAKQAAGELKQGITNAIDNLAADLNSVGFKLIVRRPFTGDVNTLRRELINTHTQLFSNAPSVTTASTIVSVTLIASGNKDVMDTFGKIAQMIATFVNKEALTDVIKTFQVPSLSPLGAVALQNEQWIQELKKWQEAYRTALDNSDRISPDDRARAFVTAVPSLTSIALQKAMEFAGDVALYGFMGSLGGDITTTLVEGVTGAVTDIFDNIKKDVTAGLKDIWAIPIPPASPVTFGKSYMVIEDASSEEQFRVRYPANSKDKGDFNIPSGNIYTNGDIFTVANSSAAIVGRFTAIEGTELAVDKYQVLSGKGKVYEYEYEPALAGFEGFLGHLEKIANADPYDKWHDIFNLGDITGGIITKAAQSALLAMNSVSSQIEKVSTGVEMGFAMVDAVSQAQENIRNSATDDIKNFLDKFKADLDIGGFDLFVIPPDVGGMDRIRYIISQWVRPGIGNAGYETPDFPEDTVFMPITILGIGPPFLQLIGSLFTEET